MARDETYQDHSPEALTHLAELLEKQAAELRAAATLLKMDPPIEVVSVRYESNRKKGFDFLTTWVHEAGKAAFDARLTVAQKNGIRHAKPPDTKPKKP